MSDEAPAPPKRQKLTPEGLFSWVGPAIRNRRTLKTWIRCCIAITVTMVLMVVDGPSRSMGRAAFFSVIVGVMLPPNMAVFVFMIAVLTLMIGMLLGWAWGSAAMASALSVRNQALLARQEQKLKASIVPGVPVDVQEQELLLRGLFLDPGSSAVYGAFMFIGNYAMGALRASIPNLALLSIFAAIVMDVICTTGPLFPTAQYMTAKLFIIPTTYYVAVAIACLILIFPESLSHLWLTSLKHEFWMPTLELLRLQSEALKTRPSDWETWAEINARGLEYRQNLVWGTDSLISRIGLINLDTSIGRLGPADLKKMSTELRNIMFRSAGLYSFQAFVNDTNVGDQNEEKAANEKLSSGALTLDRYRKLLRRIKEMETQHGHDLDTLVPILEGASANLRSSCEVSIQCVMDWFQDCNAHRWAAFFSKTTAAQIEERQSKLVGVLNNLQDVLNEFRTVERVRLIKPYEKFFDPKTRRLLSPGGDPMARFSARSLFICFVFIDTLDAFAEGLVKILKIVVEIDANRPKAKFWFPGRLGQVKESVEANEYKASTGLLSMGTAQDPTSFETSPDSSHEDLSEANSEEEDKVEQPRKRNPDAFPPNTAFGRFFAKFGPLFRFLKSPEGIFGLRMGIVSVALWIPSAVASTAWFYYEHKGLWALIMAQTGLALYAGDQIADFFERLFGTLLGLLLGMVVWYIGAGRGSGNPYGVVIATVVILSPFLFARVAAPKAQLSMWTMVAVTIVFVSGYSWINANQPSIGNPGIGINLGWKRALLVIVGFAAAFVVMLFPNPRSSRVLVRKTLAAVGGELGNIFASEVEAFLVEESRARDGVYEKPEFNLDEPDDRKVSGRERRARKISRRVLDVATRMRDLRRSLSTAKWEPQVSGRWPHEEYRALFELQLRMMGAMVLLIVSFSKLDSKWCSRLVHRTPFLNPNFLSDVFNTFSVLSSTLATGQPLPAYLPKLRERLVYHEWHSGLSRRGFMVPGTRSPTETVAVNGNGDVEDIDATAKIDGSTMGLEELTLDVLLDKQLPAHSTAVVALSGIITRIDEMADIVRTLCGEATLRGYENHQRYFNNDLERGEGVKVG